MEISFPGSRIDARLATVVMVACALVAAIEPGHPGRHVAEAVLLSVGLIALARPPSEATGFALGLSGAAGLLCGLAMAPAFAALVAAAAARAPAPRGFGRLWGVGVGAATGAAIGHGLFGAAAWAFANGDRVAALCYGAAAVAGIALTMWPDRPADPAAATAGRMIVEP